MKSMVQTREVKTASAGKTFMSGLSNVWTRFKPRCLTLRNQVKVFALCLLVYCLLTYAWRPTFIIQSAKNNQNQSKTNFKREVISDDYTTQILPDGKQNIEDHKQHEFLQAALPTKTMQVSNSETYLGSQRQPFSPQIKWTPFASPPGEFVPVNPAFHLEDVNTTSTSHFALTPATPTGNLTIGLSNESIWTWECNDDAYCGKVLVSSIPNKKKTSQDVCWLTCGPRRRLWPYPSISRLGRTLTAFYPEEMRLVEYRAADNESRTLQLMHDAYKLAHDRIKDMLAFRQNQPLVHKIHKTTIRVFINIVKNSPINLTFVSDESYSLVIQKLKRKIGDKLHIKITANSFFGIRHGLETLTQLIAADTNNYCLQILNNVRIVDKPEYPYRGLMVDTARNFISIPTLKRIIDGMSYNKLNMFHWHMTESNSFTFYSKSVPQMTQYGAYSDQEIYRPNEIQDLIQYALLRGVKIIPELDAPAHAGNGWQWGPEEGLEQLALCVNYEPWHGHCFQPPCGQLNPVNPNTYDILEKLYKDMLELFDKDVFHMGGDEVMFECWETQDIRNWLKQNRVTDPFALWGYFQWEAFRRLYKANQGKPIISILWTSPLISKQYTYLGDHFLNPKDYVIQVWDGNEDTVDDLMKRGHALIFSNVGSLYLDFGSGTWLGKDHNYLYINWQSLYDFNLKFKGPLYNASRLVENRLYGYIPQILGGEAALWSEKVDEDNAEIKIWPRTCALAESLWSNPENRGEEVYSRILIQSQRMRARGLRVDRRQPKSCDQLTGHCSDQGREL